MMPPGSGKTTYASVVFPSWYLGSYPNHRLILVSYGQDLARDMGHKTRSIIKQQLYKRIFQAELESDSRAADHFLLTNGSAYHATGYGGDLPGRRAEGAICDDILKGIAEADSPTERDNVWKAYSNNITTRLLPRAWLVIIMTHWNEDDPCGRILPDEWSGDSGVYKGKDGFDWEVLCLQAQCETTTDPLKREIGAYLQLKEGVDDPKHWEQHKSDARKWNALYQQRPRAIEGAFFHEEDMLVDSKPIAMPTKVDCVYAVIDSAVKTGSQHDGLAVTFFALSRMNTANPPLAICDWDYTQIHGAVLIDWLPSVFMRLEELAKKTQARRGSVGAFIEDKVSGTILLHQAAQMTGWNPDWQSYPIDSKLTMRGKKERCLNVSGYVAAGQVKWTQEAHEKVVTFKGSTKNHLRSQILNVSMDSKDNDADDCRDTFAYGLSIGLGDPEGF
jgi:hypothetical protein